ncbi:right-handed parallel beta-helix repeat-containing protein [Actinospica sp. MGRD01-02]|uniref:Right-handed parallel beta-helix repeat-containing protein n=1 Tax=Actinospica acidithermotolerans TaxID=2828514 RepID=A0A941E9L5_9ACTN|nr:right-handed parallel beta-helix repeat-containing protein [Actinospica acidithermotolerans]MBR7826120.1 right-handed parallel beta-helix repeat-containing protein [Actinospica acidithermotolerans]
MSKRQVAVAVAVLTAAGSMSSPIVAHAASATPFYVNNASTAHCSDSTVDSAATPFCTIQAAVDAATTPGDTVNVAGGLYAPFTVTASGTAQSPITIENPQGDGGVATTVYAAPGSSATPITVDGASFVSFKGIEAEGTEGQTILDVTGSASHISVDSSIIFQLRQGAVQLSDPDVAINDGSSDVTLSRDVVNAGEGNTGILIQGSSGDVVTTNRGIAQGGPFLTLDQATDTAVTSNTIARACGDVLSVADGSTATSIQNNIVTGEPDESIGGCSSGNTTATAALQVDDSSTAGTVEDYNDVVASVPSGEATPPYVYYSWAGTGYDSAAAFNAATGQGAHDSNSTDASAAIDSANSDAPGELSTDINGSPRVDDLDVPNTGAGTRDYYDRGAAETEDPIHFGGPGSWYSTFPVGVAQDFSIPVSDGWTGATISSCSYSFGDGISSVPSAPVNGDCTAQHTYSTAGVYPITLYVTANDGYQTGISGRMTVVSNELQPNLELTSINARTVQAAAAPANPYGWTTAECDFSFGDGTPDVQTSVNGSTCKATHDYSTVGVHPVSVTVKDSGGEIATQTTDFTSSGYYFNPMTPVRVLDTRKPIGVARAAKIAPGGTVKLKLTGTNGVPDGAAAVALTVTATNIAGGGFVVAYPDGTTEPNASNLNFGKGQTVANTVIVKLGTDGAVVLKNNGTGTLDLIADLQGFYAVTGSGLVPVNDVRVLDTRSSKTTIPAGGTVKVNLGSYTGITTAALNLTVTNPKAGGFIVAYPDGAPRPDSSDVNFGTGQTVADEAVVKVGSDGSVDFTNGGTGSVDLVVDLTGYFSATGMESFVPIDPTRYLDTRTRLGTYKGGLTSTGAVAAYGTTQLMIALNDQISAVPPWAAVVAANVTVTEPTKTGYIEAYPIQDQAAPGTSTLNFPAGATVANAATIVETFPGTSGGGGINLYNASPGTAQIIVDVSGYYS